MTHSWNDLVRVVALRCFAFLPSYSKSPRPGFTGYIKALNSRCTARASSAMNSRELEAWFRICVCGRVFSTPQAFSYHQRSCPKTKRRLSAALAKAGEAWRAKKRQRIDGVQVADCSSNEHVTLAELQSTIPQAIEASQAMACSSN